VHYPPARTDVIVPKLVRVTIPPSTTPQTTLGARVGPVAAGQGSLHLRRPGRPDRGALGAPEVSRQRQATLPAPGSARAQAQGPLEARGRRATLGLISQLSRSW